MLQKNIATSVSAKWTFPDYVQGFVGKRSIATNASLHLAKDYILKADIVGFFEAITFKQVVEVFKRLGCNTSVAEDFSYFCTLNGFLPQGLSTSPALSNIVCEKMDEQLNLLGEDFNATYSRYADDITFSGASAPEKEMIERIFNSHGFQMHPQKFFVAKRGKAQFVTGLSVFDGERPRVPKKMKRALRQELYYIQKYGLEEHIQWRRRLRHLDHVEREVKVVLLEEQAERECNRITGWVDFMTSIEPDFGNKVKNQWIAILGDKSALHYYRRNRKAR